MDMAALFCSDVCVRWYRDLCERVAVVKGRFILYFSSGKIHTIYSQAMCKPLDILEAMMDTFLAVPSGMFHYVAMQIDR